MLDLMLELFTVKFDLKLVHTSERSATPQRQPLRVGAGAQPTALPNTEKKKRKKRIINKKKKKQISQNGI